MKIFRPISAARASRVARLFETFEGIIFGFDFFISYSWKDGRHYALSLFNALTAPDSSRKQLSVFLDSEEFERGDALGVATKIAIERSSQMILIVTPEAGKAPWVKTELRHFRGRRNRRNLLIPINIQDNWKKYAEVSNLGDFVHSGDIFYIDEPRLETPSSETIAEIFKNVGKRTRREQRQRIIGAVSIILTMLLLLAGWFAYAFYDQLIKARQVLSKFELSQARSSWEKMEYDEALAFLSASIRADPGNEEATCFAGIILSQENFPFPYARPLTSQSKYVYTGFFPGKMKLATLLENGKLEFWDVGRSGEEISKYQSVPMGEGTSAFYLTSERCFPLFDINDFLGEAGGKVLVYGGKEIRGFSVSGASSEGWGEVQYAAGRKAAIDSKGETLILWDAKAANVYHLPGSTTVYPEDLSILNGFVKAEGRNDPIAGNPLWRLGVVAFSEEDALMLASLDKISSFDRISGRKMWSIRFPTQVAFRGDMTGLQAPMLSGSLSLVSNLAQHPSGAFFCAEASVGSAHALATISKDGKWEFDSGSNIVTSAKLFLGSKVRYSELGTHLFGFAEGRRVTEGKAILLSPFSLESSHLPIYSARRSLQPLSSGGSLFASVEYDGSLQVWDVLGGSVLPSICKRPQGVYSQLIPGSNLLFSVGATGTPSGIAGSQRLEVRIFRILGSDMVEDGHFNTELTVSDRIDGVVCTSSPGRILFWTESDLLGSSPAKIVSRLHSIDLNKRAIRSSDQVAGRIISAMLSSKSEGDVVTGFLDDGRQFRIVFDSSLSQIEAIGHPDSNGTKLLDTAPGTGKDYMLMLQSDVLLRMNLITGERATLKITGIGYEKVWGHPSANCIVLRKDFSRACL